MKYTYQNMVNIKPSNFKFVEPLIYSCDVLCFERNDRSPLLGTLNLKFKVKVENNRLMIDNEWVSNYLSNLFNFKTFSHTYFKRDGDLFPFIHYLIIDKKNYKQYLRKIKIKRVLND